MNAPRPLHDRERLYRHLTLVNTVAILLGILGLLLVIIMVRPWIPPVVAEFVKNQFYKSKVAPVVERLIGSTPRFAEASPLPHFQIRINPAKLRQIQLQSRRLATQGYLLDDDKQWFPAVFSHDGRSYDVKLRLRGRGATHWVGNKKSWKIRFKKDDLFHGVRAIHLVIPIDRAFEATTIGFKLSRKEGLLSPESGFATANINGVDMGVYLWMETFDRSLMEKSAFPAGEIIVHNDSYTVNAYTRLGLMNMRQKRLNTGKLELHASLYEPTIAVGRLSAIAMGRWRDMLKLISAADYETMRRRIGDYLNVDKFARWNALSWLLGSFHSRLAHNLNWFYDPTTGLFEPILWDVKPQRISQWSPSTDHGGLAPDTRLSIREDAGDGSFEARQESGLLVSRLMRLPDLQDRRNRALWRMLQDPDYDLSPLSKEGYARIRHQISQGVGSLPRDVVEKSFKTRLDLHAQNRRTLLTSLEFARVFVENALRFEEGQAVFDFTLIPDSLSKIRLQTLRIAGISRQQANAPVEVRLTPLGSGAGRPLFPDVKMEEDGMTLTFANGVIWAERQEDLDLALTEWRLTVRLPGATIRFPDSPDEAQPRLDFRFVNDVTGKPLEPRLFRNPYIALADTSGVPSHPIPLHGRTDPIDTMVDEFLDAAELPFSISKDNMIVLNGGDHTVSRNIVLPGAHGLVLEAGVTLRLGPGISIVTHGPVRIKGTAESPVRIVAAEAGRPWGTFAAVRAGAPSLIEYLIVEGGGEAWVNGIFFSGQLSFHNSDVTIRHSRISGGQADDGLSVKNARIDIRHTRFENNVSDGFDGDWVEGTVADSVFTGNGGDGLDFSGARVLVDGVLMAGMGDKALSVGERSDVVVVNSVLRDSAYGLASKDLSRVRVYASVLVGNKIGAAAYRKKQIFGGGEAELVSSLMWRNGNDVQVDGRSRIRLAGVGLARQDFPERVSVDKPRFGKVGDSYEDDGRGGIRFVGADDTPFAAGPATTPDENMGAALPDFSRGPVGLLRPLAEGLQ